MKQKHCLKGLRIKGQNALLWCITGNVKWMYQVYSPCIYILYIYIYTCPYMWARSSGRALRKAGVCRGHPALQRRAEWLRGWKNPPSHHMPHQWARWTHRASIQATSTHRTAPSASLPQGDETQKSAHPTFTVVVTQPSSSVGHQLLYVIPAAGIARSSCSRAYVPGLCERDWCCNLPLNQSSAIGILSSLHASFHLLFYAKLLYLYIIYT